MLFTPIDKPRRVYVQIVDQVINSIREGEFPPGSQLPPERDLACRLEVSRPSVREALCVLQLLGLVETKSGQGTFVCTSPTMPVLQLDINLPYDEESPFAILEAREAVEPPIASRAAQVRSPNGLAKLRDIVRMLPTASCWEAHSDLDRSFHLAVAEATENPVLISMMATVYHLMGQKLWCNLVRTTHLAVPGHRERGAVEHRLIYEAIKAGDSTEAAARTRKHLKNVGRDLEEAELVLHSGGDVANHGPSLDQQAISS